MYDIIKIKDFGNKEISIDDLLEVLTIARTTEIRKNRNSDLKISIMGNTRNIKLFQQSGTIIIDTADLDQE